MKKTIFFILFLFTLHTTFAEEISKDLQRSAWNSIRGKFLGGESKELILFQNEIAIKLLGNVTAADSACMIELIDELEKILPHKSIFLTNTVSNLNFTLNYSFGTLRSENSITIMNRIKNREIEISFSNDSILRKKALYYNLYRSLVTFNSDSKNSSTMEGCVFDEDSFNKITFHPVDYFILQKLYAPDFQEQFKKAYISHTQSPKMYYTFYYTKPIKQIATFGGLILSLILITLLVSFGVFNHHNWSFKKFSIQVLWALLVINSYIFFSNAITNLHPFLKSLIIPFLIVDCAIVLVSVSIYIIEKKISFSSIYPPIKITLKMLNMILFMSLLAFLLNKLILKTTLSLEFFVSYVLLTLTIVIVRLFLFFLSEIKNNTIRQKDVELARLSELNKQAQLQSLQSKINPHFLYNALNSIASLANRDNKKTEQMALALSDFFKYSLNKEQKEMVTLKEEIESVETYLTIEKVRFEDKLNYQIEIPEELENTLIPQFIIQPIVENAVKHGVSKIIEEGLIRLNVTINSNILEIKVFDNGPAFTNEPTSGYGLQSIQEKLVLLYENDAYIALNNDPDKHVLLSIPLKK